MTSTGAPKPEIQILLDMPLIAQREEPFLRCSGEPEEVAKIVADLRALPVPVVDKIPVAEVWDFTVSGRETPVRGYRPAIEGPLPLLVYFHGGGWVFGSIEAHDAPCRGLATAGRCIVLSVDYGLAPEHPFPEPVEECYAATRWLAENAASYGGDPDRVLVGGGSSGGNLAVAVALKAAELGFPRLSGQVLFYPALDGTTSLPSHVENASGYNLSAEEMRFYWDAYHQGNGERTAPLLSPLHATDLTGLPPTIIHTAEFDVLRDEGEAFGERLAQNGVPAVVKRYAGQIHGFASLGNITPDAGRSIAEMGEWLVQLFAGPPTI
jgi:acetyl esterase